MEGGTDPVRQQETARKLNQGKELKDKADAAFKAGDVKAALMGYHQSLLWVQGLDKSALPGYAAPDPNSKNQQKSEIDDILEKIHSNMSACHVKNGNWKRAMESADKAIAKNDKNYKAIFRKGKALGELGYFEKAEKLLTQLKKDNPTDEAIIDAELARQHAKDKERERIHSKKFRGFLSNKKLSTSTSESSERNVPLSTGHATGHIEEVEVEPSPAPTVPDEDKA
ncbi:hypothetical protein BKA62DRAFT_686370 [Auriculariales sp. MPI-PUGE-AT-0066]|nr:hypothetical protein BKA62DRAFT_686370 [Auriculariales sp. MPI-PUGE-AT-0066]